MVRMHVCLGHAVARRSATAMFAPDDTPTESGSRPPQITQ